MSYKIADDLYDTENELLSTCSKYVDVQEKYDFYKQPENYQQNTNQIKKNTNLQNPRVWGPGLWLTLHVGSLNYPLKASQIVVERMKNFILGLPYILPCNTCSEHSNTYILSRECNLETICSGRNTLFKFFVDLHNYVNKKLNKPIITLEEAYHIYT